MDNRTCWEKQRSKIIWVLLRIGAPVMFAMLLLFLATHLIAVDAQTALVDQTKIGPGVLDALRSKGQADVMIALVESSAVQTSQNHLSALQMEVASLQESVLAVLKPEDFEAKERFRAVPALGGKILSEEGLWALASHPGVRKIDLDAGGAGSLSNSVPFIGADTWQDAGVTGDGVVVAILDSGLDTDHSDFAGALIHEACFADNDGSINGVGRCPNGSDRQFGTGAAEDDAGHGSHVTGIVASRGNVSSVGVAPGSKIVAIRVTYGPSFSGAFYTFYEIVAALDYIITDRPDVKIINMSLGTDALLSGDCDNSTAWTMAGAAAINTLRSNGVIAFASAGNNGSGSQMTAPACLSNVISVGATDNADNVASFSNSNSQTDVFGPGVNVVSSAIGNGTTSASGTSMASPHAAGCAALLVSGGEAVTPDEIEARLETSPFQVTDPTNGLTFPRIDCSLKSLADVQISGPISGSAGIPYPFIASAFPITSTLPITYVWEATGQPQLLTSGGLSNSVSYTWNIAGQQVITVTAINAGSTVSDTHTITILLQNIYLPIILK